MNRRNWTTEEERYLEENACAMLLDDIAHALDRSRSSINNKMRQMHIYTSRFWTKEQEEFLRSNYGEMETADVAKQLGMSGSSVYHKAQRMGLKHSRWWTEDESDFLVWNYSHQPNNLIAFVLGRTVQNIQGQAQRINITRKNFYPEDRYCVDCGIKLANKYMGPERCAKCAAKNRRGENHPMWQGGVSTLYKIIQRNLWKQWKRPILERDGFKCQWCGQVKNLEVHHLRRLVIIRDDVMKANNHLSVDSYDDRAELARLIVEVHTLEDGITLCYSCHKSCHIEKPGELRETPNATGEGNPQPSRPNVISMVGRKVQRLTRYCKANSPLGGVNEQKA